MRTVGCRSRRALANRELVASRSGSAGSHIDLRDVRRRRRRCFQFSTNDLNALFGAFEMNLHSFFAVEHPAARVLARASRNTNGRNPTPCTTPRTVMEQALAIVLYFPPTTQPRPCQPT